MQSVHWRKPFIVLMLLSPLIACAQTTNEAGTQIDFRPVAEEFEAAAEEYRAIWRDDGDRIAAAFRKFTGLTLEPGPIDTIVYEGISFSGDATRPMRMRASYPLDTKRGTLVHELSHRLIWDVYPIDLEDHPVIFLFLYDVWVELWGQEFADAQVAIESRRRGRFDYESAWQTAIDLGFEGRRAAWQKIIEGSGQQ